MKFTLGWLKDHLETDSSLDEIVETLIKIGLEVDTVDDPGAKFAAFTVAHVVAAEKHPDADRLQVCTVDTGDGQVQVVCGRAKCAHRHEGRIRAHRKLDSRPRARA